MSTRIGFVSERWIAALSALVLAACSPISDVRSPGTPSEAGATSSGAGMLGVSAAGDGGTEVMRAPARLGRSCDASAVDSCSADWPPTVVTCVDGAWTVDTVCRESERCQSMSGSARCTPVTDECIGHEPGVAFCDAQAKMRVCIADGTASELRCGDNERCQTLPDRVRCSCEGGTVPSASGCQAGTSCDVQNGGCDTITSCDTSSGSRVCGDCPGGYLGTGMQGCEPQLQALIPSCGTLDQVFSPNTHSYKLTVPTLCQALQLTVTPPDKSTASINGMAVPTGAPWQSGLLAVGGSAVKITLNSQFGMTSEYMLDIERIGSQREYIKSSNAGAGDVTGLSVAADGDTIVVGAPYEDSTSATGPDTSANVEAGAVYVYTKQNGAWVEQQMLKADPPVSLEYFGTNVAISGDTIAIGAPGTDPLGVTTLPANGYGSAYVFTRDSGSGKWTQQQKLRPKDGPMGDFFGLHVAIRGDTLLVGAPFNDDAGMHSGAIYEFTHNLSTGKWDETQKIKALTPTAGSTLGFSIVLDGNTFVTGASLENNRAGAAYVFVHDSGKWEEQQRLQMPSPVDNATFGWQLALFGDTAVISAPRAELVRTTSPPGEVYVFERSAGRWSQTQMLKAAYSRDADQFGSDVDLNANVLVIGASGDASSSRGANGDQSRNDAVRTGAVSLYAKQGAKWVPTAYLKADNADGDDIFGLTVALSKDALAISAPFEASSGTGVDADQSSNDAARSGAVYVFE